MKKLLTAGAVAGTLLASTAFATEAKAKTDDEALLGIGAAVLIGAAILAAQDDDHRDRGHYRDRHDRRDYGRHGGNGHHYGKHHRFNQRKAARIAERRYHLDVQETARRDGKIIVKGWDRRDHWTRIVFNARSGNVIKVKRTDRHRYDRHNRNRDYSYNDRRNRHDRWDRDHRHNRYDRHDRRGDHYNHRR